MLAPMTLAWALWLSQPRTSEDLELSRAVEESILTMAPRGAAPPEPYNRMIEQMGSTCFRCRELASRQMQRASAFDYRWLFWARKSRDPEIVVRATAILRRLNPCQSCNGTGESTTYPGHPCWKCDGIRTSWIWAPWD